MGKLIVLAMALLIGTAIFAWGREVGYTEAMERRQEGVCP